MSPCQQEQRCLVKEVIRPLSQGMNGGKLASLVGKNERGLCKKGLDMFFNKETVLLGDTTVDCHRKLE